MLPYSPNPETQCLVQSRHLINVHEWMTKCRDGLEDKWSHCVVLKE